MSLYRGLFELGEYSLRAESIGVGRVGWRDIWVEKQGLLNVLLIMFGEWVILLMIAFYFDQVLSIGSGVRKHPLWFMRCVNSERKRSTEIQQPYFSVEVEKSDVAQEVCFQISCSSIIQLHLPNPSIVFSRRRRWRSYCRDLATITSSFAVN